MQEHEVTASAEETPIAEASTSARDAIEKAFESLDAEEETPELTEEATEVEEVSEGPARGPDGKFVAKEKPQEDEPEPEVAPEVTPEAEEKPVEVLSDAPSRFSADAKAEWAKAPASIQGEIKRAISEMESGLAKKDEALRPLQPYIDMAAKGGTTIDAALGNYVAMEQLLARDPKAGMERLAMNMGKTLPDFIAQITGGEATSTDKDREILGLKQQIQSLQGQFGQVNDTIQQQQMSQTQAQVAAFAEQNPRFEELSPQIAEMLKTGFAQDLPSAYEMAEKLNPLPVAPLATPAPAQTRQPKSVTGSPTAGSNPATVKPSGTRNEALTRAFDRVGL